MNDSQDSRRRIREAAALSAVARVGWLMRGGFRSAPAILRSAMRLILQFSVLLLLASVAIGQSPTRKFRVSDAAAASRLVAAGGKVLADYGAFQLIEVPAAAPNLAALTIEKGTELRSDYDTIQLNAGAINTTVRPAKLALGAAAGKRLHLVHFAGPVKPEWVAALRETGVEVVTYVPSNAYLVYGNATALNAARTPAAGSVLATFMDWEDAYQDTHKIDPTAKTKDAVGKQREIGTEYFAVQLIADREANPATVAFVTALAAGPLIRSEEKLNYYDIVASLPPERLPDIAARPDVISIQPYFMPEKFDERQDQIIAGNLAGSVPSGPGYLSWLGGAGFSQNQFNVSGFAVDVTDSGIDNGTAYPNHFGLYQQGQRPGNSRVVYNRLEGTANSGSTLKGVDGHGNLNSHIIGGYNNLTGFPHQDASGFRYGLGVAPFVRLGSSVIFDPSNYTSPSFRDLQSRAYRDGARISSNSWGANTSGAYNIDAQSYDALVRDAQPTGAAVPVAGNQEMVIVFANGNAGSAAQTVGSPGTAKNVISVGAAENVQAFGGADGSGVADTGADNANDIISFSSRGPCADGRTKPEIVAPGTHVSGGVWQTANPAATGTADPLFVGSGVSGGTGGSHFFPGSGATQQFYTASSGTSHSTPCVAGGAALVRQYFLNRNMSAPSPAMTKSFLMNSSRYLNGVSANDTLPSNSQGMGEMNLGMAFDNAARFVRDQLAADKFTATGQTRVFNLTVVDPTKPLRITAAWTDAPGSTTGNAYKNDLDLTVVAGGNTYKGNVFAGANSVTGGTADLKNNAESVFLPAGVSGAVTVTVTASSINSDGVPGDADLLDQDFALVAYNALPPATASVLPNGSVIVTESIAPANGLIDNTETVSINFTLQNAGSTALGNLVATLQNSGGVTAGSAPQTYGAMAVGASATAAFSFTASGAPGSVLTATFSLADGATNLGNVTFSFRLAAGPVPTANGATITAESFVPANGYIDPAEVVTVDFAISNTGDQAFGNLTATLQATGGVVSPGAAQNYGAIPVGGSVTRSIAFTGSGAIGSTLTATLQLQDGAVNYGTVTYTFRVGPPPDYFTEIFTNADNDTDNQSWLFTPNGSGSFYGVVRTVVAAFPTDPTGGTPLALSDDSFVQVTPTGGVQVSLYGVNYTTFFVGSNGYVTFGSGDTALTESLAAHFAKPRIAALFDDLNPGSAGTVTWRQLADRVAVTFQGVPEFAATNSNNFQIEMFFDGRIRITCLAIASTDGLIGLSRGLGTPADFVESDFGSYAAPPTVTTPTSAGITSTTATLGGNLTATGGGAITARGVVYALTSVNSNPQIGGSGVTNAIDASTATGVFTENITGLTPGGAYSFVAYATNSAGTTYTTPVATFSALAVAPTVTTPTSASITSTTATLGGNLTATGGGAITARGVVYALTSVNSNPQIGGSGVTNAIDAGTATGVFTENVTGLTPGGAYSFVAYATNSKGTTYTTPVSTFTTLALPTVTSSTANLPANAATMAIAGTNFDGAVPGNNTVAFNDGAVGSVTVSSATSLTVTFSTKPVTAGSLTAVVTTPSGSSGAAVQVATVTPVVTLSPAPIPANATTVTINGFGFSTTAGNNTVLFSGGATGTVTVATATQLTVTSVASLTPGNLTAVVTTNGVGSGAPVQVGTVGLVGLPLVGASFFGGAGDQQGTAIAINGGAAYLSGNVQPSNQTPADTALVLRFNLPLTASPAWSRTFAFGTMFSGIGVTSEGVYPAGWNYSLSTDLGGGKEVKGILAKFNSDGSDGPGVGGTVWEQTPNVFAYNGFESFSSVATDVQGATTVIYANGYGQPNSYSASFLKKYDSLGTSLATVTDPFVVIPPGGGSAGLGVTVFGGNVYQAGSSGWVADGDAAGRPVIWKYDLNLAFIQRIKDNARFGQFNAITSFGGSLYAVGYTNPLGGAVSSYDYLIEKYDTAGNLLWAKVAGGANEDVLTGVVGLGSKLYAVGYTRSSGAGGRDAVLLEIDPATGNILSSQTFGGAQDDQANGVATDGTDIYIVGESRSYAQGGNSVGENDVMLLRYTPQTPPTVTSPTITAITTTGATLGGNVTSDGGAAITARGVVYAKTSDNSNPQIGGANVSVANDAANTTGVFAKAVTGLAPNTNYSFVAFATNSVGTTYTSPVSTFTTAGAMFFSNFMDATVVVGQANFTDQLTTASQTVMAGPSGCAISSTGKLAICDQRNKRVLIWNTIPTSNGVPADVVVGKPDFTNVTSGRTASITGSSDGVAFSPDGSKLIVSDSGNNRVLIWNTVPTTNGVPADLVVGQTDFVTGTAGTSATKLNEPSGLFVTAGGKLLVTDFLNNRVLVYNSIPTSNGAAADIVIGQSDMATATAGNAATQLNNPFGGVTMAADGRLLVSDYRNARVVVFNTLPTSNGASADVVIGQGAFGTPTSGVSSTRMAGPAGVTISPSGQLAVSEFDNHRVLIFNTIPTTNGAAADFVLGQPDFTSSTSFNGGVSAHSMAGAYEAAFALDGRLLVPGRDMHRLMIFGSAAAITAPVVITPTVTGITTTSATLGGNVSADGGQAITERGVVYSITATNSNPQIGGTGVTKLTSAGTTGVFTVNATGLAVGTGYSFAAYATNSVGTTYTSPASTFTTLNNPPVANPVGMMRYPTQGVKISIPQLLTNATDPDPGDVVSLLSVGTPANGTTLMAAGYVFYTPNAGWLLGDSFTYTVQDNHGAQATSTVTVSIITDNAATNNIVKFTKVPGGPAEIDFAGIPGFVYGLQYKLAMTDPVWLDIGPVTVSPLGAVHYTDNDPARKAAPQGFYRFVYPAPAPAAP